MAVVLHQCNLPQQAQAVAYLDNLNAQDLIVFYGHSADWLNTAFLLQCQQKAAAVYCVDMDYSSAQKIDHYGWALLVDQADKTYTWK